MSSHKTPTINRVTFNQFKTIESIYYNRGFQHDAINFNLTEEDSVRIIKERRKVSIRKFIYRTFTLLWFSGYYLIVTGNKAMKHFIR